MTRRLRVSPLAGMLLSSLCSLGAADAQADCLGEPEVHWTYPADGDTNIPPDALIWIRHAWVDDDTISATLNGAPLLPHSELPGAYVAALSPSTEYTVAFSGMGASRSISRTFTFTTGSAAEGAEAPDPEVVGYTPSPIESYDDTACRRELFRAGCYDTGEDTIVSFDVVPDEAFLWMTEGTHDSTLTRGACGQPVIVVDSRSLIYDEVCVTVHLITRTGSVGESDVYCLDPPDGGSAWTSDAGPLEDAGGGGESDAGAPGSAEAPICACATVCAASGLRSVLLYAGVFSLLATLRSRSRSARALHRPRA